MSVNEIVLSDYFYPFNQLTEQDFANHRFIRLPQHCSVTSAFVINGNFGSIFNALKVDKLSLLQKLISTKHITETWLKFCSNINYKSFMFFNINIKYGYKVVASTKAVYGHNALLIIPSDIDKTGEISKYIETHFKQETLLSKVFDCFGSPFYLLFPKPHGTGVRYDTTVHLLFDFTKEFTVSLSQTLKDLKRLVQKPLNIIGLEPHEIATDNFEQHEIAGDILNLILMGLKIRYTIEKDFPACTGISTQDNVKINEIISEISTKQLKLSTAMGLRRSNEAKEVITETYKNISSLLNFIFYQYGNYFFNNFENDSTVIFPKIPFAETLLKDFKKIYHLLKHNFSLFGDKIFFKWNETTKFKMASDETSVDNYGIIVTEESYETIKEMSENFGNNVFWGFNLSVNFNNIEPLLFIGNNQETLFGFAEGNDVISVQDKNESDEKEVELLFTPCSCQCLQFRHWICKSCWNLMKVLKEGNVGCECGVQKMGTMQKECFQCILNSKSNVSHRRRRNISHKDFKEARDQLSNFFKLQDPPKQRPKKLKKVEIIPPDPHISSPKSSAPPPPTRAPPAPPAPPITVAPAIENEITLALEQLHENVKVATELCEDVLQKVAKSEIPKLPEPPKIIVEEPISESLEVLKQKVEEALEYVEEIKEHEESKTNSEA